MEIIGSSGFVRYLDEKAKSWWENVVWHVYWWRNQGSRRGEWSDSVRRGSREREAQKISLMGEAGEKDWDRILTRWIANFSLEAPGFSWEALLLAADRRKVGDPVKAVADMLFDLSCSNCVPGDYCQQIVLSVRWEILADESVGASVDVKERESGEAIQDQ